MREQVLITGGSGLIGKTLTGLLLREGYSVVHLSRNATKAGSVRTYRWDPASKFIDVQAVKESGHIIHLAGASIATRWTAANRRKIFESRIGGAGLLYDAALREGAPIRSFISSSAVGYYGNCGDEWLAEDSGPGSGYLPELCTAWEAAASAFSKAGIRVAVVRTGLVLSRSGGLLAELLKPMNFFMSAIFGNGQQFYPWIHPEDLCSIYLHLLRRTDLSGIYNGTAPQPERMRHVARAVAAAARKKVLEVPAPKAFLKVMLGGFASSLYESQRCSADKIQNSGFVFRYPSLKGALEEVLR